MATAEGNCTSSLELLPIQISVMPSFRATQKALLFVCLCVSIWANHLLRAYFVTSVWLSTSRVVFCAHTWASTVHVLAVRALALHVHILHRDKHIISSWHSYTSFSPPFFLFTVLHYAILSSMNEGFCLVPPPAFFPLCLVPREVSLSLSLSPFPGSDTGAVFVPSTHKGNYFWLGDGREEQQANISYAWTPGFV